MNHYISLGVEQVWDCTGVFLTRASLQPYLDSGVSKVVVSAPVKDAQQPVLNIVYGVNHVSCVEGLGLGVQGFGCCGWWSVPLSRTHSSRCSTLCMESTT